MNSVEVLKGFVGNSVIANALWVDECDSTMLVALAEAASRGPGSGGFVVGAGHQSAGRGRLDRRWEDRPGASMLATYAIWPDPAGDCSMALSALGLAVRAAVVQLGGPELGLKWPNDLVVGAAPGTAAASLVDKKVGGLLGETHRVADRTLILLGVGVNLRSDAVPAELADRATSLDALGMSIEAADLMCAAADQLASRASSCVASPNHAAGDAAIAPATPEPSAASPVDAGDRLIDEYRAACVTIGRTVRVEMASGDLVGAAVDVEDDGALVIEAAAAEGGGPRRVTVRTGDVTHLRDHRSG